MQVVLEAPIKTIHYSLLLLTTCLKSLKDNQPLGFYYNICLFPTVFHILY